MNPYADAITILTDAFEYFNNKLINGELPTPIINIFSKGRRPIYGWMWASKWIDDAGKTYHEISIMGEYLNRPVDQVLETLLHEIAHLYNEVKGIKDCLPASQYHNKHFKEAAEQVCKLRVEKVPTKGYAFTALTDTSRAIVQEFCKIKNVTTFNLKRVEQLKPALPKIYVVTVTEEDKEWVKAEAEKLDIKEKVLFSQMREAYENQTKDVGDPTLEETVAA